MKILIGSGDYQKGEQFIVNSNILSQIPDRSDSIWKQVMSGLAECVCYLYDAESVSNSEIKKLNSDIVYELTSMLSRGDGVSKNDTLSVAVHQIASEKGNIDSKARLGWMYINGIGVKKDVAQAFNWYLSAAKQGHLASQHNTALMYLRGDGVNKDIAESIRWFESAARGGYNESQYLLGLLYANGSGVKKDEQKASEWLFDSAQRGNDRASNKLTELANEGSSYCQYALGKLYYDGIAFARDDDKALQWWIQSAAQGNQAAVQAIKDINSNSNTEAAANVALAKQANAAMAVDDTISPAALAAANVIAKGICKIADFFN